MKKIKNFEGFVDKMTKGLTSGIDAVKQHYSDMLADKKEQKK